MYRSTTIVARIDLFPLPSKELLAKKVTRAIRTIDKGTGGNVISESSVGKFGAQVVKAGGKGSVLCSPSTKVAESAER